MSYDITLYPRQAGQDWPEVVEAAEADDETLAGDESALATGVELFRRIEARLESVLDGPIETWVAQETGGDVYGEATALESGIEVALFDRSAEVSFTDPDSAEEGRDELHRQVRRAVEAVARETGYVAYDPQTRESFDGLIHEESTSGALSGTIESADGVPDAGSAGAAGTAGAPRRNPVNLQRRGWVYLILGAVLVVLAGQRMASDNGGALSIALLVIGILDVLGGLFLLSVAKRGEPDESSSAGGTPQT